MNQENSGDVYFEMRGKLGVITLNRPAALNALTLEMIRKIRQKLGIWHSDPQVDAVFFRGAGDRAFCAGGDIKKFYQAGMNYRRGVVKDPKVPALYFGEEYCMNREVYEFPKPVIAFMAGITMGGGYGIAGHASYRIACETTRFAMPEAGIGFFPDVGSMYYLTKISGYIGKYLALTGAPIGPGDMLYAGLADSFMPSQIEEILLIRLAATKNLKEIEFLLNDFARPIPESETLKDNGDKISAAFSERNVREIFDGLARDKTVWAGETLTLLQSRSPSSLMVTAEQYERAKALPLAQVLEADFTLAQHFIARSDLYEGIYGAVIDRTHEPKWSPPHINYIGQEDVETYFQDTGYSLSDII